MSGLEPFPISREVLKQVYNKRWSTFKNTPNRRGNKVFKRFYDNFKGWDKEALEHYCHLRCVGCDSEFKVGEEVYVIRLKTFQYCHTSLDCLSKVSEFLLTRELS